MLLNEGFDCFYKEAIIKHNGDVLLNLRSRYEIPASNGIEKIYLAGNSLGLQPKSVKKYLLAEIDKWSKLGVDGHFDGAINWFNFHSQFDKPIARLLEAKPDEVLVANTLTVNIHLLLSTFYKPTQKRFKILIESPVFSSDYYAVCSQIEYNGLKVEDTLIELKPREGEFIIRMEDILQSIDLHKNELALVWMGGVNFYTGQVFDLKTITEKAHQASALVGFDLAHAIGNVPLHLHEDGVDFAAWCSYKYLNSSPGGVGGLFVHEKHHPIAPAMKGWWGVDEQERFKMEKEFKPLKGAKALQLSNAPIVSMAVHKAALNEFETLDFEALRNKSIALSGFLIEGIELIIKSFPDCGLEIITPRNEIERGCQVSIFTHKDGKKLFDHLTENQVVGDWREPSVIRISPVPMYNTFEEIGKTIEIIKRFYLL